MIKTYITIAICVISFGGGMLTHAKLFDKEIKIPPCPEIPKCPPTNKIQTIDFNKLKRIKGNVTIEQVFNGDVYLVTENDTIKMN